MSEYVKIRKGLDIKLKGQAEKVYVDTSFPEVFALKPDDFTGVRPKLLVSEGDDVKAGTPLFYGKDNEKILYTSPVSGKVDEIRRGEKRKILEIRISTDKEISYVPFKKANPKDLSREEIIESMLNSGVWPLVRQRP